MVILIVNASLSSADFFLRKKKKKNRKNAFRNTQGVSNNLDPDQNQFFVSPDLEPNCLQMKPIDEISALCYFLARRFYSCTCDMINLKY